MEINLFKSFFIVIITCQNKSSNEEKLNCKNLNALNLICFKSDILYQKNSNELDFKSSKTKKKCFINLRINFYIVGAFGLLKFEA